MPAGFAVFAHRAIRFDMLERLEDELEQALATGTDAETLLTKLVSLLGSGKEKARAVLAALGWRTVDVADAKPVWRAREGKARAAPSRQAEEARTAARSQFALCGTCGAALAMSATRLDKWLFHARFYRTRLLAQAAASAGKVRLNGVTGGQARPCHQARRCADLGRGAQVMAVRVLALAERRGPASEARNLYEVLE